MTAAAPVPGHGGILHDETAAFGIAPESVLDFSVNVSPYGPCPDVVRAAKGARLDRYPDPTAAPARHAVGAFLGVASERVLVASGAAEILWGAARALLAPGDTLLVAGPAFGEMRAAAVRRGARVVEHRTEPGEAAAFDVDGFEALLRRARPRLAYVATPSNPCGVLSSLEALGRLAEGNPTTQMVVDVSFLSLSDAPDDRAVHRSARILWVQSLTKELSVPGLRIGFAVGPEPLVAALEAERPPWAVSAPAEAVAIAATTDAVRRHVAGARLRLVEDRRSVTARLSMLGLRVHPSHAPYVLVDLAGRASGAELRTRLLRRHRVLVRDAASFGLPGHVRIAARPAADVDRLLAALGEELP